MPPDDHRGDHRQDLGLDPSAREARLRESQLQRAMPIYYALLMAIVTGVALYFLFELRHVVLLLFISLLFAAATAKPAAQLQRLRIPEGISVVMIYLVGIGLVTVILWYVVPPLLGQIVGFGDDLPSYGERLKSVRESYDRVRLEYPELNSFDNVLRDLGARVVTAAGQRVTALPNRLFTLFLDVLSVFVISIMIVTSRRRIRDLILLIVGPRYRVRTNDILSQMWDQLGHYLRAKLIVMAIIGSITFVVLWLLDVPFPLLLAIVVALGEVIPRIGPWLARIPLLTIAAFEGWTTFGLVAAASIVIENAKGLLISPLVEGDQLDIHPLLVIIAVLVGSTLFGPAGAFVAVPGAAMIQILFESVVVPWRKNQLGEFDDDRDLVDDRDVSAEKGKPLAR